MANHAHHQSWRNEVIAGIVGGLLAAVVAVGANPSPAASDPPPQDPCGFDQCTRVDGHQADGSYRVTLYDSNGDEHSYSVSHSPALHHFEWSWVPLCSVNSPANGDALCGAALFNCPSPGDIKFRIYFRDVDIANDPWHIAGMQCLGPDPTFPAAQARQQVERQFRDLPLQPGALRVQPDGRAIVNLPTIFYAETPRVLTFTVTALGRTVNLTATPQAWHWHWGDETADATTDDPGAPYPHETVTHRYAKPDTVHAWVTVDWVATYTIAGVNQTFQITDPVPVRSAPVAFTVREARSELVSR